MKSNKTIFCLAVICAVAIVCAASFYGWHSMTWNDETASIRELIAERQAELDDIDAQIEERKNNLESEKAEMEAEELRAVEVLQSNIDTIEEHRNAIYTQFYDVMDVDYRVDPWELPTGKGTQELKRRVSEQFGLSEDSYFVKNLVVENEFEEFLGETVLYTSDFYGFENCYLYPLSADGDSIKYFCILRYWYGMPGASVGSKNMGFICTVDGGKISISEGYTLGRWK